jgi:hypothetical protein
LRPRPSLEIRVTITSDIVHMDEYVMLMHTICTVAKKTRWRGSLLHLQVERASCRPDPAGKLAKWQSLGKSTFSLARHALT